MQWTTMYGDRYQTLRGHVGGLPAWGRMVVFVFALPGILAVALSIALLLGSLALLFLLAAPAYVLMLKLAGGRNGSAESFGRPPAAGVRHVDVTVIEQQTSP